MNTFLRILISVYSTINVYNMFAVRTRLAFSQWQKTI